MANVRSSITAHLQLDRAQFTTGLREASQQTRVFGKDLASITTGPGSAGRSSRYAELAGKIALAGGAALAAKGAVAGLFDAAANRESLFRALSATSDGARSVEEQFDRLQAAALRSGVGVDQMTQSFIQLRGAGLSSNEAEKTASAVANALNRIGRGADFEPVMANLKQISSRTTGLGDEIKETANYLPEIRKLSQLKFGTDTGDGLNKKGISGKMFVAGITEELAKYETAAGGAKAAAANFQSSLDNLKAAAGSFVTGPATKVMGGLTSLLNSAPEGYQMAADDLKNATGVDLTVSSPAPVLNGEQLQKKRTDAAEEARVLEEARAAAVRKALGDEEDLVSLQQGAASARADGDAAAILAAETDLALAKEKQTIMRDLNATEEEATAHIKKRVRIEQESANDARARAMEKTMGKEAQDLALTEAEANGTSPRRLKKLQKEARLKDETQRLKDDGFTHEQAAGLATRKIDAEDRLTENRDRASRGLRPRTRTITDSAESSRRAFGRLSTGDKAKLENLSTSESAYQTFQRKQRGGLAANNDDPLAQRDRSSRIQGAGRQPAKEPGSTSVRPGSTSPAGGSNLASIGQIIINELQALKTAVQQNGPSTACRGKANSTSTG